MNATFVMQIPAFSGNSAGSTIPQPLQNGSSYTPGPFGFVTVAVADVQVALNAGWTVGQGWPYSGGKRMTAPNGVTTGTLNFEDGTSGTIVGGIATIPYPFINAFRGYGWAFTDWGA
jgi:hypothetical protein